MKSDPNSRVQRFGVAVVGVSILLCALAYFGFLYVSIWHYTMDDSYISFRYSRNMIDGYGLRFNPTDALPTEGFTSILWLIAMAPAFLAKVPADAFAKVINLCFVLVTALFIGFCIAKATEKRKHAYLGILFPLVGASAYLCFFPVSILSVSGMETALSALLVTLGAYQVLRFEDGVRLSSAGVFATTLLAMSLVRPDLSLLAVAMLLTVFFTTSRSEDKRLLIRSGLCYVLAGTLYFGWRWWYFSSFLPLPFYIKAAGSGLHGVDSVLGFLKEPLVALTVALSLIATGKCRGLFLGALAYMLFFTKPEHLMGEGHRFLMPILPILIVVGLSTASKTLNKNTYKVAAAAPALLTLLMIGSAMSIDPGEMTFLNAYAKALKSTYGAIGETLKNESRSGVVAVSSVGLISYTSNWSVIDMFGLCNATIAKHPDERLDVTFRSEPNYIILVSSRRERYTPYVSQHRSDFNQKIFDTAIEKDYHVTQISEFLPGFYLFVLKR